MFYIQPVECPKLFELLLNFWERNNNTEQKLNAVLIWKLSMTWMYIVHDSRSIHTSIEALHLFID